MVLNAFKSGIFLIQLTEGTGNLGSLAPVAHFCDHKAFEPTKPKTLTPK